MSKVLTGLMPDATSAAHVLDELEKNDVPFDAISVITSDKINVNDFMNEAWQSGHASSDASFQNINVLMAGLTSVGVINHMDIGVLGAGPLVASLSAGRLGAAHDSALGGLRDLGITSEAIAYVEHAISEGGVLIGVHVDHTNEQVVCEVMTHNGAQHISAI